MKKLQLLPSTRLAIQGAVAVSIAIIFQYTFNWQHSYWAVLTAMLLISQTWGESLKKSFDRVSMTIVGCSVGTFLHYLTAGMHSLEVLILLGSVFFAIYFFSSYYYLAVLFISNFVVFFFAILESWTLALLSERILETIIGALIVVIVTAMILPIKGRSQLRSQLLAFNKLAGNLTRETLQYLGEKEVDLQVLSAQRQLLLMHVTQLKTQAVTVNFELIVSGRTRKRLEHLLLKMCSIYENIASMIEVLGHIKNTQLFGQIDGELVQLQQIMENNFNYTAELLEKKQPSFQFQQWDSVHDLLQEKTLNFACKNREQKLMWLEFYSYLYYLTKVYRSLQGISVLLDGGDTASLQAAKT